MKVFRWAVTGLLALWSSAAAAQDWPAGPVTIIVPFAAGSTVDIVARTVAENFTRTFKQAFIIENKPGSAGNLGTSLVAKAPADGRTLGVTISAPLTVNAVLFPKLPYDPARDIVPITMLVTQPSVLVASKSAGIDTVEALVDSFRKEPTRFNYGTVGIGTLSHLAVELVATKTNGRPVHIPFSGTQEAIAAMTSGEIQLGCFPAGVVAPYLKKGDLKMLALTSARRSTFLPDVPTLKEIGIADVVADAWIGLVAPGGTDPKVIAKVHQAATVALADPKVVETFKNRMMEPVGNSPEEFAGFLRDELARWLPVIEAGKIRLN